MNDAYKQVPEQSYYSYDGPSQVQGPIRQKRRLGFARSSLYSYHLMVQLTTGEPRHAFSYKYMEDVAYGRQKDDVMAISNAYTPPSTDVNTWHHYAGKEIKDDRVQLADEKTAPS